MIIMSFLSHRVEFSSVWLSQPLTLLTDFACGSVVTNFENRIVNSVIASSGANRSDCKFEFIDDRQLRVCFCQKCDCFLGGGSYGKVFKATVEIREEDDEDFFHPPFIEELEEEIKVAIKYPNSECHVDYEIATLKKLDHCNILKYYREFKYVIHRYIC